jgi:WD40 repeat protein
MHTFSVHHFPVTSLIQLPSGRMASASEDGQVLVLELFSRLILLNIHLPHGIKSMAHENGRLFFGSIQGTVYSVDTNAYSMHQTEKQGATFAKRRRQEQMDGSNRVLEDTVFGVNDIDDNPVSTAAYQSDWVGHDYPVSSIVILGQGENDEQRLMVSGDDLGQVRIWDLESRTCLNVSQPWSQTSALQSTTKPANPSQAAKTPGSHPVTSICIIPQSNDLASSGMFQNSSSHGKNTNNFASMVGPLQKFMEQTENGKTSSTASLVPVPFLKPNRSAESIHHWQARPILRKKRRSHSAKAGSQNGDATEENAASNAAVSEMAAQIKVLQERLKAKQSEVERWENVNNKLMAKLTAGKK